MGRNLKDFYAHSGPNSNMNIESYSTSEPLDGEKISLRKTRLHASGNDDSIVDVSRSVSRNRDVKKHATRLQKVANGDAKPLRTDNVRKATKRPDWQRQWGEE